MLWETTFRRGSHGCNECSVKAAAGATTTAAMGDKLGCSTTEKRGHHGGTILNWFARLFLVSALVLVEVCLYEYYFAIHPGARLSSFSWRNLAMTMIAQQQQPQPQPRFLNQHNNSIRKTNHDSQNLGKQEEPCFECTHDKVRNELLPPPPKFWHTSVVPQHLHPEHYQTFRQEDFPICTTERELCQRGIKARAVLDDFYQQKRPRMSASAFMASQQAQSKQAEALLQNKPQENNATMLMMPHESSSPLNYTPTVRVLLHVPDWYYRSSANKPNWDAIRDPNHCFGVSCDARFGALHSITNDSVKVTFHQWPPPLPPPLSSTNRTQINVEPWKPHVYFKRLGHSQDATSRILWDHHHVAHALESGESCGGTERQYNAKNLNVNPATILAAMTEGQVPSFVNGRSPLLASRVLNQKPPTLNDFPFIDEGGRNDYNYYSGLFVSNCNGAPERSRWLAALMNEIPIASYGPCPRQTPGKRCPRGSKCQKIVESGKYPFAIAFENHPMLPGYLTEKVMEAYLSNSLPVLWSAPDIDAYLPQHSFIDVRNFTSPQELAQYLRLVRNSTELYDSYFAWRRDPQQVARWQRQFDVMAGHGMDVVCGVCHAFLREFVEW